MGFYVSRSLSPMYFITISRKTAFDGFPRSVLYALNFSACSFFTRQIKLAMLFSAPLPAP